MTKFSSDGFDLDAITSATDVLELGGKVVKTTTDAVSEPTKAAATKATTTSAPPNNNSAPPQVLQVQEDPVRTLSENYKQQGNDAFGKKQWSDAYEYYTKAIQSIPGITGPDLLRLHKEWQNEQSRKARETLRQQDDISRSKKSKDGSSTSTTAATTSNDASDKDDVDDRTSESSAAAAVVETFTAPHHEYAKELAIYYSNRAAASMQLAQQEESSSSSSSSSSTTTPAARSSSLYDTDGELAPLDEEASIKHRRYEEAIQDCTIALLWQPNYVKAMIRRCTAYERIQNTEAALADAIAAQKLDPSNTTLRSTVLRLQKLEDARMEELKTETLAKLKDLGNSILGNFGLSLDNFNAQKDPNTGSYSISFNQNK